MPKLAPCAVVLAAFAASAQSRGPVVPNFQHPEAQQPAAEAVPKSDDAVELVGPTAAQEARARAAAAAKARAEADERAAAEAKVRAEAEARARVEAEAKARALAEARAAEETKLRVAAEARAKAEAELRAAAEARFRAEAEAAAKAKAEAGLRAAAQARAAAEAAEQARAEAEAKRQADEQLQAVARAAASERQRAADEAKAAAQAAAVERDRVARADAEARAQAAQQLKARAHADAVEKARAQALAAARRKDEGRCAQKRVRKDQDSCRAKVAARYAAPLALPPSGAQTETLALAPLVAPPQEQPARSVIAPGAPQRSSAIALAERNALLPASPASGAMIASPPAVSPGGAVPAVASGERGQVRTASTADLSSQRTAIPRDEPLNHARHAEVRNELQIGPSSLVLDRLTAVADLAPESVQGGFAYRLALDDSGAAHHLFGLSIESARCELACGLRWFASGGYSPQAASTYGVERKVASKTGQHTDQLAWSAATAAAGAGWSGGLLSFAADGQIESLSMAYLRNVDAASPARTAGTLTQLRLRGTGTVTSGSFSGSARLAGFAYAGDAPESFQQVPMRGALLDDDQGGLAGAPQAFEARLEGRYESQAGFAAQLSYGYLSYVGPLWSAAHIGTAAVSQRFGHFRLGFGLVVEGETDSKGNSYPTVFGTGSVGAAF